MKVLMVNSVCAVGSTGRICTDLADILAGSGHICKIAYGRKRKIPDKYREYAVYIQNQFDFRIHALNARLFDNAGFGSRKVTKKLIAWIEAYDPDLIHLHNLHGYYINIEILFDYLKKINKPVIWTLHDCWAFTGHCAHFSLAGCDRWMSHCEHCPQKKVYPASCGADRSFSNFERKKALFTGLENMTIVTPSHWLKGLVGKSYLSEYPVQVIHNGIDLNVFKYTQSDFRKDNHLENKTVILGVASVWNDQKGHKDFIQLSKKLPGEYQIVLVGLSDKQKKNLPRNILGISKTNHVKELAEIYSAADVFLNLTYEDTYPTVNLEAQACKTPVITYQTGGSVESVPERNVVKQGDIEAVARMITSAAVSSLEIRPAAAFDSRKTFEQYVGLYDDLLKK